MDLKEKLRKNRINIKLISLVMAFFLWSYVMREVNPEISREYRGIDVQFTGEDYIEREGLSILSPQNPKVSVKIEGTRSDLATISANAGNIVAEANVSGVRSGENVVNIKVSIKEHSGRIRILEYEPSQILLNVDKVITENLEISISPLGELPEGYTLGNVGIVNKFVRVTAPSSVLNNIAKVVVYPVISEKTETFMVNTPIVFLDKNDNEILNLHTNVKNADVEVPIYKVRSVPVRPIITGNLGQDEKITNIKVVPENIAIKGPAELIDKIAMIETEEIYLQDLIGSNTHEIDIKLPEGISLYDSDLDIRLEYEYINNVQKNLNIPISNFSINNKNSGLKYVIKTEFENINVNLYGESSLLEELSGEDLKAFVDVRGLKSGEYVLEINIENLNEVSLRGISPQTLEIQILDSN